MMDNEVKKEFIDALPNLRAFARSLCGNYDRADDLVQETLAKALAKIDSYEKGSNAIAWLITILRNHYYSEGRKLKREVQDSEGIHASQLISPGAQMDSLEMQDFMGALQLLPDDQREALLLIGASGFSYDEAADIIGVKTGTVKSRVSRARARLNDLMNGTQTLPSVAESQNAYNELHKAVNINQG
jgi:RNA polymerase sigma-70 factor (ECF subfamily)